MDQSGVWRGSVSGRVGMFKFSHVEILTDDMPVGQRKDKSSRRKAARRPKPTSVEELMQRIGLEVRRGPVGEAARWTLHRHW